MLELAWINNKKNKFKLEQILKGFRTNSIRMMLRSYTQFKHHLLKRCIWRKVKKFMQWAMLSTLWWVHKIFISQLFHKLWRLKPIKPRVNSMIKNQISIKIKLLLKKKIQSFHMVCQQNINTNNKFSIDNNKMQSMPKEKKRKRKV